MWFESNLRSQSPVSFPRTRTLNKKASVIAYGFDETERYFTYIWNPATNARVMLESADGGFVQLGAINDHGDVVRSAGQHAAIWRVRKRDLAAEDR